jgi:hypothetical protein
VNDVTSLTALGIKPQDVFADFETWRHTLLGVVELSEQEDDLIGVTAAEGMVVAVQAAGDG